MRLGCLNVDGIDVGKLEDMLNECEEWKLDVMCLTETHLREMNGEEHAYRMICKGRSKQSKKGGGNAVLVRKASMINCEVINVGECELSEDIMAVKLEYGELVGQRECLYVCVCYMTIEGQGAQAENKRKYECVKNFVSAHEDEKVLVIGDMNGHIGLLGERINGNGRLLREACEELNLEILNETMAEGRVTWRKRGQQSAIDYILVNEKAREKVVSMSIDEDKEFGIASDHNLLLMRYECKVAERRVAGGGTFKWRLKAGNWTQYRDLIGEVSLTSENDVDDMNSELISKVREVAREAIGRLRGGRLKKGSQNVWWSEDIKKARQERKDKCRRCRRMRSVLERGEGDQEEYDMAWNEYIRQQRHVKHLIRKAKVKHEKQKLDELKRKGEEGGRDWYRFLQGKGREEVNVDELVVMNQSIRGKEQIAQAVKEFWEDIGGMNEVDVMNDAYMSVSTREMEGLDSMVRNAEVEHVLKNLKNDKAAGLGGIPYEMFKRGGDRMVELLTCLFNRIWNEERVPQSWNESKVILLHKGGHKSKKELKNYRPIALMDTVGKIFCMLVNERLKGCFESKAVLSEEQNGFRMGRRGEDNLFIVRELMDECMREKKSGYFAFLDIEKAYDRVNRRILCKVLEKCGVSDKLIKIISSMYVDTKARYVLGEIETEWVHSRRGVRQGCILSPLLFSVYTEELILRVKQTGVGMKVGNERLGILLYADDVIIMSEGARDLQCMLDEAYAYSQDFCVKFSEDKSKVIVVNGILDDVDRVWQLGDVCVKRAKEYKYLGVTLTENGCERVTKEKLAKANQWYGRLGSVARLRANKYEVLRELWKSVAVPSVLHGMNVMNWNETDMQKLEAVQNKVGRVALGANAYAAVEAIRGDMGWSTFSERCMKGCMMFKIRIERMEEDRWVKKVCKHVEVKSKWLKTCKRVVRKCGLNVHREVMVGREGSWIIRSLNDDGQLWSTRIWKKVIGENVAGYGLRKWKSGMQGKSTLQWYDSKEKPAAVRVYDGSFGSELLFKVRSQSLEVNARTYRWNEDGSKECKVCAMGIDESVYHVIVECAGYMRERQEFMTNVRSMEGSDIFNEWSESNMGMLLGVNGEMKASMEVLKDFLVRIWCKRSRMSERGLNERQMGVDHNYVRE